MRVHRRPVRLALAPIVVLLLGLCFAAAPAARAEGGRATGTVVDETGKPVAALRLRLVTEEGTAAPVPPIEVKKGKFAIAAFPPGAHRLEVVDPGVMLTRIEIELRGSGGARIGDIGLDVPPGATPPSFQVGSSQRAEIKLVISKTRVLELTGGIGIEAAKAGSATLKKLNDLFAKGDMQGLLVETEKVLAAEPDLGGAVYLRGVALWKTGRAIEAVPVIERAAELTPDQPGVQGVLGVVRLDAAAGQQAAGDEAAARALASSAADAFAAALVVQPGDRGALTNRVIALERAGRPDDLVPALEALVAADPTENRAYLRAAEVLMDAGRNEEALRWLDRAPLKDAETVIRMYNATVPLYNAGRMDLAAEAMRKAIAIAPQSPHPHHLLGEALIGLGDMAGAAAELQEFVRLAPDDPEAESARLLLAEIEKARSRTK